MTKKAPLTAKSKKPAPKAAQPAAPPPPIIARGRRGGGPDKPTGKPRVPKTVDEWDGFLAKVAMAGGNVSRACETCQISRVAVWNKEKTDPTFKTRLDEARKLGIEVLEEECVRRAFEGVEEPVGFFQGVSYEVRTNYSDTLIQFLLRGNKPEKFRERTENINMNLNLDLAGRLEKARRRKEEGQ